MNYCNIDLRLRLPRDFSLAGGNPVDTAPVPRPKPFSRVTRLKLEPGKVRTPLKPKDKTQ